MTYPSFFFGQNNDPPRCAEASRFFAFNYNIRASPRFYFLFLQENTKKRDFFVGITVFACKKKHPTAR